MIKLVLKNNKILEYGFYILIFLLPLQTRWMFKLGELNGGYWEYGTMSLYAVDILLIGLLIFSLVCKGVRLPIGGRTPKQVWFFIGGLELFIFISIFFASNLSLAFYGYTRFLLAIGLFWLVIGTKYDKIKLYWVIVLSGVVQSILAMQQFALQRVYANKWLGMAFQNPENLGVSVIDTGFRRWLRAYGSLPHPNILGGFLAVCLLVGIILYFHLYVRAQDYKEKDSNKYRNLVLVSWLIFIFNFIGLLLTFSRTAWVGFLVGFVVFAILTIQNNKRFFIYLSKFFLVITVLSILFGWGLREPLFTRFNFDNRLENKSVSERVSYNNDARQVIKNNWLFGAGIKNYGLAVFDNDFKRSVYEYEPVHNVFLLIWAEVGIIGLIFFVSLLVYLFINLLRKEVYGMAAMLLAIVLMIVFDHWMWSVSFGMMFFWLIIGMICRKD